MRKGIVFLLLVFLSMLMVSCNKPVPLKIKTPVVNPVGGTYTQAQNVTITCETPSAEIRYTLDGSEPSTSSTLYNGTINITSSATLTAKAFKTGWTDSDAVTNNYKLLFQLILTKCIGGAENDKLISIIQTSDGGYVAVGITESNNGDISDNHGSKDGWIIKVDSEGNLIWSRCFGGSNNDNFFSIYETNNGDYLIAGITSSKDNDISDNHGKYDGWIMEVSSTGNKLWSKCFGGNVNDYLSDIIQTSDGFVAVGCSASNSGDILINHGDRDGWIIKVDTNGNKVWSKTFGGSAYDSLSNIIRTSDGFVAVGYTESNDGDLSDNHGFKDGWILKINEVGNKVWSKCFGGNGNDYLNSIVQASDGYIAAGSTFSNGEYISGHHGGEDGWILKIDEVGNPVWSKCFGGSIDDTLNGIIQATDGGYMAVGNVWSTDGDFSGNHNLTDSCLIKVNSVGDKEWLKCFGGNSLDSLWDLIQITDGGYIAVGLTGSTDGDTSGNHGKDDGWIIKLK